MKTIRTGSSTTFLLMSIILTLLLYTLHGVSACSSYGINVIHAGTYYFNPTSQAPFSFNSGFSDCTVTETPVLKFPDGRQVTCTPVNTTLTNAESVCPVSHAQMVAGDYTIIFASVGSQRFFTVINTQSTVFVTITSSVTATVTPTVTVTDTATKTDFVTTTLVPVTVTVPASTSGTLSIRPITQVTVTKTIHHNSTVTRHVNTTKTTQAPQKCTQAHTNHHLDGIHRGGRFVRRDRLLRRDGPDGSGPTTTSTVTATPVVVIVTKPAVIQHTTTTVDVSGTVTVTPTPQTAFSGYIAHTITLPTRTRTKTSLVYKTTTFTKTKSTTYTVTTTPTPTC